MRKPKREPIVRSVFFVGDDRDRPIEMASTIGKRSVWSTQYFKTAEDAVAHLDACFAADATGRVSRLSLRSRPGEEPMDIIVNRRQWTVVNETVTL